MTKPDYRSPEAAAYRRLYKTARWLNIRAHHLGTEPLCRMCKARGIINDGSRRNNGEPQTNPKRRFLVVDHVKPHKGDETLFFSGPFQTLCPDDHDGVKQGQEARGYSTEVGADGIPIDPLHPFNA